MFRSVSLACISLACVSLACVSLAACTPHADPTPATDAPACDPGVVELVTDDYGGRLVAVQKDGAPAYLLLDTGSQLTFLQTPLGTPDVQPNAGTVLLACKTESLVGRPEAPLPGFNGIPTIGQFGADRLLAHPSEVDLASNALHFRPDGDTFIDAATWQRAQFDNVYGLIVPHVALDGVPLRLELDTGAPGVTWVGQPAQPGDVEQDLQDASGAIVPAYRGTAMLDFGAWHGSVSVLRVPSWPYFEEGVAQLGGNIAGLIGLSALGGGFVLDEPNVVKVNL